MMLLSIHYIAKYGAKSNLLKGVKNMKITPNGMYNPYAGAAAGKVPAAGQDTKKITKNFDEIVISAENQVATNDKFTKDLSAKISREVRTSTPASQLEELKSRIETGNYEVDLNQLVKKMMLE